MAIEIDTSLPTERVVRVLEQVVSWRGQPQAIRLDNGHEVIPDRLMTWCVERGIELRYIQPGKPDQNAFIVPTSITRFTPNKYAAVRIHNKLVTLHNLFNGLLAVHGRIRGSDWLDQTSSFAQGRRA